MRGETITLDMLLRSPSDRERGLDREALYLDRDDDDHLLMPAADTRSRAGDELLLAGTRSALNDIGLIIANEHTLAYILSGEDLPGGSALRVAKRRRCTHACPEARPEVPKSAPGLLARSQLDLFPGKTHPLPGPQLRALAALHRAVHPHLPLLDRGMGRAARTTRPAALSNWSSWM